LDANESRELCGAEGKEMAFAAILESGLKILSNYPRGKICVYKWTICIKD
jgi:hypothetical protein